MARRRDGFSLIEILISIAIIAILIGMMLPAIQKVREASWRSQSMNNLKQISLACHNFHDIHQFLPPTCGWDNLNNTPVEGGGNGSAFFLLLPYIEQSALFYANQANFSSPQQKWPTAYYGNPGSWMGATGYASPNMQINFALSNGLPPPPIKTYLSPADPSLLAAPKMMGIPSGPPPGGTSYLMNHELLDLRLPLNLIDDGSSNTIMFAEGYYSCNNPSTANALVSGRTNFIYQSSETYYSVVHNYGQCYDYTYDSFYQCDLTPPVTVYQRTQIIYYDGANSNIQTSAYNMLPAFGRVFGYVTGTVWNSTTNQWVNTVETQKMFQCRPNVGNNFNSWSYVQNQCVPTVPQGMSPTSINVAMADGSARTVGSNVSPESWRAAITPKGGEVIGADFFD